MIKITQLTGRGGRALQPKVMAEGTMVFASGQPATPGKVSLTFKTMDGSFIRCEADDGEFSRAIARAGEQVEV